jgi:Dihydrodipicolinate synthase/N-acetylneuraminate lyase
MFRGTFTALVTPFRDGGIDVSAFEQLIETQIAAVSLESSRSARPANHQRSPTKNGNK